MFSLQNYISKSLETGMNKPCRNCTSIVYTSRMNCLFAISKEVLENGHTLPNSPLINLACIKCSAFASPLQTFQTNRKKLKHIQRPLASLLRNLQFYSYLLLYLFSVVTATNYFCKRHADNFVEFTL